MEDKRLFFALEAEAPWWQKLPKGRLIKEDQRHLTVAFLGNIDFSLLKPHLSNCPIPGFQVGLTGVFDKVAFLPKNHPKVVAYHTSLEDLPLLIAYVRTLGNWLNAHGFTPHEHKEFLPHITICRAPFDFQEWRQAFHQIPVVLKALHLYESAGGLQYTPIWTHHLHLPFEELDHTADVAFNIYGESLEQLFRHSFIALAFKDPELIKYWQKGGLDLKTIDDVIIALNQIVARADSAAGSPFKAVSFHGEVQKENGLLKWEMIVDV